MKRGYWISLIVVAAIILIGAFIFLTSGDDPLFAPSDVKVSVGNAPPKITNVPFANVPVSLTPGLSKNVLVQFTARDPNGYDNLNDASALVTFRRVGETDRAGGCVENILLRTSKTKTYDCTVSMQYYDGAGDWTMTFFITDLATPTPGSDTLASTFFAQVGQLKAITYNTNIDLGVIAPSATNVTLPNVGITNQGNFNVPTDGSLSVTARDLIGVTASTESIPASVFLAGDSSGDVCGTGIVLINNTLRSTNVAIPRGPSGSNQGSLGFCISLVPEVSAQDYEATSARLNPWLIEI